MARSVRGQDSIAGVRQRTAITATHPLPETHHVV
jgi:hypothetical protein